MSKNPTRGIIRERQDYSHLLSELQRRSEKDKDMQKETAEKISSPAETLQKENKSSTGKKAPSQLSPFRQRLLSDSDIRFFSSKNGKTAHDKTCPLAREISDDSLVWTRDYPYNLQQCPKCCIKAYTRLGARDFGRFSEYKRLFEDMGFQTQDLRLMYVEANMETTIIGSDTLKVRCRNDTWMLRRMPGSSKIELLHNNYIGYPNGTRKFTEGYHSQAVFLRPAFALKSIENYHYSYEAHAKKSHAEAGHKKKIRYVYELGGDMVHDETCPALKDVPAANWRFTESYPLHLKPCPICNTKACARLGAKDFEKFSEYEEFFAASHIPQRTIRRMYIYDSMETEIVSPTRMKVWNKDDVWIMEILPDSRGIQLWHGNFKVRHDWTRTPSRGFHKQGVFRLTHKAVSAIAEYTYQPEKYRKGFSVWMRRLFQQIGSPR